MSGLRGTFERGVGVRLDGPPRDGLLVAFEGRLDGTDGTPSERVVAEAWRRSGSEMMAHLRGAFVLAVWDPEARTGLLARDPMGVCSLYTWAGGGRLVFASELAPLLAALPATPGPDEVSVLHWLSASDPREGRTLYEGVRRLPPGHRVELGPDGWHVSRYWAPRHREPVRAPREEIVARVRAELVDAVARASDPGGGTAVLLSGGLDSGSVLAAGTLVPDAARRPAAAYSAVFPGRPSLDEEALIIDVATALDVPSHRLAVRGGSMLAEALRHMQRWELPLVAPNQFVWHEVLRRAAGDGARVMLDGEGGDFVFAAPRLLMADRLRAGRPRAAVRLARSLPGARDDPPWRIVLSIVARYGLLPAAGIDRRARPAPAWLLPEASRRVEATDDPAPWRALDGPRWWAYLADALTLGADALDLYGYLRRRAADAGMDAAQPLLDQALVELVLSLPPEAAFDPFLSRPLLREATAGVLPDSVRRRARKSYFDPLIQASLSGPDLPLLRDLLLDPRAEIRSYAEPSGLMALARGPDAHTGGPREWATDVWRAATAELWLRHLADQTATGRALADDRFANPDWSWLAHT